MQHRNELLDPIPLSAALRAFSDPLQVTDRTWTCPRCQEKSAHLRKKSILKLPEILVLDLRRQVLPFFPSFPSFPCTCSLFLPSFSMYLPPAPLPSEISLPSLSPQPPIGLDQQHPYIRAHKKNVVDFPLQIPSLAPFMAQSPEEDLPYQLYAVVVRLPLPLSLALAHLATSYLHTHPHLTVCSVSIKKTSALIRRHRCSVAIRMIVIGICSMIAL